MLNVIKNEMEAFPSTSPLILRNFDEATVLTAYKLGDYYWECCIVGFLMHHAINLAGQYFVHVVKEVIKFSLVLLLTAMMGYGIFRLWEGNDSAPSGNSQRPGGSRDGPHLGSNSRSSYPYLVDIPSKQSGELNPAKKFTRPKKKDDKADEPDSKPHTRTPSITTVSSVDQ